MSVNLNNTAIIKNNAKAKCLLLFLALPDEIPINAGYLFTNTNI